MKRKIWLSLIIFFIFILSGCTKMLVQEADIIVNSISLTGVVKNQDGNPAANARVEIFKTSFGIASITEPYVTTTKENGSFYFYNLPSGNYYLSAANEEGLKAQKTGINIAGLRVLNLGTLSLSDTIDISGIVTLEGEDAHLGTKVYLAGTTYIGITGQEGAFNIYDVPEGAYTVYFSHNGFIEENQELDVSGNNEINLEERELAIDPTFTLLDPIKGDTGPEGEQGEQGATGSVGEQGVTGNQGEQGATGDAEVGVTAIIEEIASENAISTVNVTLSSTSNITKIIIKGYQHEYGDSYDVLLELNVSDGVMEEGSVTITNNYYVRAQSQDNDMNLLYNSNAIYYEPSPDYDINFVME
ncbi:carboxypeptidase regulatory-like domain-containing protein [Candidatus Margulisiibacteriota bacterium]